MDCNNNDDFGKVLRDRTSPSTNGLDSGYQWGRHPDSGNTYIELDWSKYAGEAERRSAVNSLRHKRKPIVFFNPPSGAVLPLGSMPWDEADVILNPNGREARQTEKPVRLPTLLDSAEFFSISESHEFIIDDVLVAGQTMLVAALPKMLKTWLVIHAAVSIGLGGKFLGKFATRQRRVAVFCGESGTAAIQEVARHAAFELGAEVEDADILWATQLPNLIAEAHRQAFAELLCREEIDVVILDPAYMCLPVDGAKGQNPANVLFMANLLAELSGIVKRAGATLVIVHHFKKSNGTNEYQPADLGQAAMSGFAEVAGQWWLLSRREQYRGDGNHQLWLAAGCRAGSGGLYALDVIESAASDGVSRTWQTTLRNAQEFEGDKRAKREQRKADHDREKRERLLAAIAQHPEGETKNYFRGLGWNGNEFDKTVKLLGKSGLIERCEVLKRGRPYEAWRLVAKGEEKVCETRVFGHPGPSDFPVEPDSPDKPDS